MAYNPYIVAHRFGLGAEADGMRDIASNPRSWFDRQLQASVNTSLPGKYKTSDEISRALGRYIKAKRDERKAILKNGFDVYRHEMKARFEHAVRTDTPLIERMVMFWSNHFAVSFKGKPQMAGLVGVYEREAIRPHVLGKFSDILRAVVEHPAMLVYLDNVQSFGPNSVVGKKRKKGLNENLAREILELHTLGVDGGYTQDDVIGFAKVLTGWTVKPPRFGGGGFNFIKYVHEPGAHKVLGKTYDQDGQAQGVEVLKDLARHPSTARFIATKMARHFISDKPSASVIRKLEQTFKRTDGDLADMMRTIIGMRETWVNPLPKVKTPYEMIVSSFRALGASPDVLDFKRIAQSLALLDNVPFQAPSPQGWPDTAQDWLSPNATISRVEWCHAFAQVIRPTENPLKLAQNVMAGVANADTLLWIERAPSPVDGLALMLASPEWQRR